MNIEENVIICYVITMLRMTNVNKMHNQPQFSKKLEEKYQFYTNLKVIAEKKLSFSLQIV